jgi:hypothetical protein
MKGANRRQCWSDLDARQSLDHTSKSLHKGLPHRIALARDLAAKCRDGTTDSGSVPMER